MNTILTFRERLFALRQKVYRLKVWHERKATAVAVIMTTGTILAASASTTGIILPWLPADFLYRSQLTSVVSAVSLICILVPKLLKLPERESDGKDKGILLRRLIRRIEKTADLEAQDPHAYTRQINEFESCAAEYDIHRLAFWSRDERQVRDYEALPGRGSAPGSFPGTPPPAPPPPVFRQAPPPPPPPAAPTPIRLVVSTEEVEKNNDS